MKIVAAAAALIAATLPLAAPAAAREASAATAGYRAWRSAGLYCLQPTTAGEADRLNIARDTTQCRRKDEWAAIGLSVEESRVAAPTVVLASRQ